MLSAGSSSLSLPRSTSCMAATDVTSFTMEAMRKTVSVVIFAAAPVQRTPKAPSYRTAFSVAAMATTPGASPASRPARSRRSISLLRETAGGTAAAAASGTFGIAAPPAISSVCNSASRRVGRAVMSDAHRIFGNDVAIERDAELWNPLQRLEIDVVETETLFEAEDPFEIVHQTPQEIAAHRRAFRNRALQLRQVVAEEHDAVEIVDMAVGRDLVLGGGAVLGDIDVVGLPDLRRDSWHPVGGLRPDAEPFGIHVRERSGKRQDVETRRALGGDDVELGRIDVQPDEIDLRADDLQFVGRELRRVLAGIGKIAVGVFAFQDHAQNAGVQLARRVLGGANIVRRIDRRHAGRDVFGKPQFRAGARASADRLHRKPMAQHDVVTCLVQFTRRQLETGRIDPPAIAEVEKTSGFVKREEIFDALAQPLRHVTGVVGERLRRRARLPTPKALLQGLRQVPMIKRGVGLDAVGE